MLNKYLVAKHVVEDLEPRQIKHGQKIDESAKMVHAGEADPEIQAAATELYKFQDDTLRYAVDSGLLSEGDYTRIIAANKFYVPMFRAGKPTPATGLGNQILRQPIKRIKGSDEAVVAPIRSIVNQTNRVIQAADMNRLLTTISKHEGQEGAEKVFIRGKAKPKVDDDPLKVFEEAEEIQISQEKPPAEIPQNFKKISLFEDGQGSDFFFDPDVARAIGAYGENSKGFIEDIILGALSLPAQALRVGTVDMPAFFLVKNPVRDAFTVAFQSKNRSVPGISTFDGLMSVIGRDEAYKLWVRSGGENSTLVSMDRPQMRKMFRQMMTPENGPQWKEVGETLMTPVRVLQAMTNVV